MVNLVVFVTQPQETEEKVQYTFNGSLDTCFSYIFTDGRSTQALLKAQRKHGSRWGLIGTFR